MHEIHLNNIFKFNNKYDFKFIFKMTKVQKVLMFGADAAAFHIYNVLYNNNWRYSLLGFYKIETEDDHKRNYIYDYEIEKLKKDFSVQSDTFSFIVLTPQVYIEQMCSRIVSHSYGFRKPCITNSLASTQLKPNFRLISIFGSGKSFVQVTEKIINHYSSKLNIALIIPRPPSEYRYRDNDKGFIDVLGKDIETLSLDDTFLENALKTIVKQDDMHIYIVSNFISFNNEIKSHGGVFYFFLGYKTFPVFFKAKYTLTICDVTQFTSGSNNNEFAFDRSPSLVLLRNSSHIICCRHTDDRTCAIKLKDFINDSDIEIIDVLETRKLLNLNTDSLPKLV